MGGGRGAELPVEGQVSVRLLWSGGGVRSATLTAQRPQPAQVLRGQTLAQAEAFIPRVYSLCGEAQGVAAGILRAQFEPAAQVPTLLQEGAVRVGMETVREHLWRLGLDWPALAQLPPTPGPLRSLMAGRQAFAATPAAASAWASATLVELLGAADPNWPESLDAGDFLTWRKECQAPLPQLLRGLEPGLKGLGPSQVPAFASVDLAAFLSAVVGRLPAELDYAVRPDWAGQVLEMGPAARLRGAVAQLLTVDGAVVDAWFRLVARVLELAQALLRLRREEAPVLPVALWQCERQAAVALEMARGVLLHWVALDNADRIADYRIVAPTEWNFHPRGPAFAGLTALGADNPEALRDQVTRVVMALDPCVRFHLELSDA